MNLKINRNREYVAINATYIFDKRLSLKAKGIMSIFLTHDDPNGISIDELVDLSTDGEKALRNGLNELVTAGYIARIPTYIDGKIDKWEFVVSEKANVQEVVEQQKTKETIESEFIKFYETNIGAISPMEGMKFFDLIDDYGLEIVIEAVKEAILSKAKNKFSYSSKVLKNWNDINIKTITELEAHRVGEKNNGSRNFTRDDGSNNEQYNIAGRYTTGI